MCKLTERRTNLFLAVALSLVLALSVSGSALALQSATDESTVTFTIEPEHATIDPTEADFDLYDPADVTTTITWNDATEVEDVIFDGDALEDGDYSVTDIDGDTASLAITQAFIEAQDPEENDELQFTISFDVGEPATLTVNVVDTEPDPPTPVPVTYYDLTIEVEGEGTADPEPGTHRYEEDEEVTVEATPDEEWFFSRWLIDDEMADVTEPEITVTVDEDITLTAVFQVSPVAIPPETKVIDPEVGGIIEVDGVARVDIPEGATEHPVEVSFGVVDPREDDPAERLGPRIAFCGRVYELSVTGLEDGERITRFDVPLTVTFSFDSEKIDEEEQLLIHRYDEEQGIWVPQPTRLDRLSEEVSTAAQRFSYLAIFEEPDQLTDIEDHWAEEYILEMTAVDAVDGYPDLTFRADEVVTREQFAKMLVEAAGLDVPATGRKLPFLIEDADEVSDWAKPYVEAAIVEGFITGYEDDTFRPLEKVNRAQVAVMLSRALGLSPIGEPPFLDADEIPNWAAGHVAALSEYEIVRGYPVNGYEFLSYRQTTRAEAAAFLSRYLDVRLGR